jgi:starch synthase
MPRILMVTSEASPYAKTGGLGDVLGALPAALVKRGEEVAVVLPRYRMAEIPVTGRVWHAMSLWVGPHQFTAAIDMLIANGVRYYFVDCPPLYDRAGMYSESGTDYPDNHIRFGLLNQAALGIARNIFKTDVIHGHDWPAGLLAPYLRALEGDPTFYGVKTVFTIHNLGYQGLFPASALADLGLSRSLFHPAGLEFFGQVNFLKAGIVWSDAITTVSPTYAREIQTPEYGFGLDGLLRDRAGALTGILNGVDYGEWDPRHDPHIAAPYSAGDLSGKAVCKRALIQEMFEGDGFEGDMIEATGSPIDPKTVESRPLIGIVSRFATQKGFDIFLEIASDLLQSEAVEDNVAFAALGSGDPAIESAFRRFAKFWPDRFAIHIGYDNALAHRIEAGADMFLMPSRYEPSGLSQMYSLRYGTVPIVRATGGLEDSVDQTTGFKFDGVEPEALLAAIRDALAAWRSREDWVALMQRGMAKDFSWTASAARYQELYRSILSTP